MSRKSALLVTAAALCLGLSALLPGSRAAAMGPIVYDSIPATYPGSFPSLGYEATSTDEFGDHVQLTAGGDLGVVTVSLTDWACENDYTPSGGGAPLRGPTDACVTTPGSGFTHPITLNIYAVDNSGPDPAVGALIASKTLSALIPFRPSWDSAACTGPGETPATDVPFGGRWFDPVLGTCVHGYAFNLDFDFTGDGVVVPGEVIAGVAYNTADYGAVPIGVPGPYNSLNVSLTTSAPTVGMDAEPDTAFWDTSFGPFYCDGGAGGIDTFRRDAGCWAPYTPVMRFHLVAPPTPTSIPPTAARLTDFSAAPEPTGAVRLAWATASEHDLLGFRVERAATEEIDGAPIGPWQAVGGLVSARGGPSSGAHYAVEDRPGAGAFAYRLVIVNAGAPAEVHGPLVVTVRAIRAFLPLVLQR